MAEAKLTTTVSTKGQMILPKAVRDRRGWGPGVRLVVEETPEGVLLKEDARQSPFRPTRIEDVYGMLKYDGPPVSTEDMKRGAEEAAVERYLRSFKRDDRE